MREQFWKTMVDVKIAERYFFQYIHNCRRWKFWMSAVTLIASSSSIATWLLWTELPGLWAIIIALSQVASVFSPLLPFTERQFAASHAFKELGGLFGEMEAAWIPNGDTLENNEDCRVLIKRFNDRRRMIEEKFISPEMFPTKPKLHQRAQEEAVQYFKTHYSNVEVRWNGW